MGTWKKFGRLSRGDRRLVLEAGAVMISTRVGLRVVGYRRWELLLARFSSGNALQNIVPADLARITGSAARNLFFQPTCLERSIGLWWMLRRRGIDATIHIGGRKDGGKFEAHAWVECEGLELSDSGAFEYSRFGSLTGLGEGPGERPGAFAARSTR